MKYGRIGASAKLFALYQTLVLDCPSECLGIASGIDQYVREHLGIDDARKLGIDLDKLYDKRVTIKKLIVKLVADGRLTFGEYYSLFNSSLEFPRP